MIGAGAVGRAVLASKKKGLVGYPAFRAAIAALATNGPAASGADPAAGKWRVVLSSGTIPMLVGSSWAGRYFPRNSGLANYQGAIAHAFASQAAYEAQRDAGREVYFEIAGLSTGTPMMSFNRNGVASDEELTGALFRARGDVLAWYDDVLGPLYVNPFAGTGPQPF